LRRYFDDLAINALALNASNHKASSLHRRQLKVEVPFEKSPPSRESVTIHPLSANGWFVLIGLITNSD